MKPNNLFSAYRFSEWPLFQKTWVIAILFLFWVLNSLFSYQNGNRAYFHTDETGEQFTIYAANRYIDHGFFENYLLPTYPPFGRDPSGKNRSEPFVYTHYLAGQDLVLGLVMKAVGKENLWMGRLVPLSITVVALTWLTLEFSLFISSSLLACVFLSLLMLPRALSAWAFCLYGHSYVMAFYLLLVSAMLWLIRVKQAEKTKERVALAVGIAGGIGQMFFDLDWVPGSFVAVGSFALLLYPLLKKNLGTRVFLGFFIGACLAFTYQVTIGALHLGSLTQEISDLMQWLFWRVGQVHADEGINPADLRIHKMWHLFNNTVYGGTGWTALNLVYISFMFLVLGGLSRVRSLIETRRLFLALFLALLASMIWTLLVRQHAYVHMRFIHRHAMILYVTMLFIAFPIAKDLVNAARKRN